MRPYDSGRQPRRVGPEAVRLANPRRAGGQEGEEAALAGATSSIRARTQACSCCPTVPALRSHVSEAVPRGFPPRLDSLNSTITAEGNRARGASSRKALSTRYSNPSISSLAAETWSTPLPVRIVSSSGSHLTSTPCSPGTRNVLPPRLPVVFTARCNVSSRSDTPTWQDRTFVSPFSSMLARRRSCEYGLLR